MQEIFDEYVRDFERQKLEESSKQKAGAKKAAAGGSAAPGAGVVVAAGSGRHSDNVLELPSMASALQIMDRMINQNMYEGVAMDFKYWEDPTDGFRWGSSGHVMHTQCQQVQVQVHHLYKHCRWDAA
jgi:dynein intermediate chain 1